MKKLILAASMVLALLLAACQNTSAPVVNLELVSPAQLSSLPVSANIKLEFSRGATVDERVVSFTPPVAAAITWSDDGRQVVITPEPKLSYDTHYILRAAGCEVAVSTEPLPAFTLFAGGDVLLDRLPGQNIAAHGPGYVFAGMGSLIKDADLAFANLESPASRRGSKIAPKNFTFRSTPEALDSLVEASIDVVSFTNNHCLDYGMEAFLDTLEHLRERGIASVGAGRNRQEALSPYVLEVRGVRVAFLAFTQKTFLPAWSYDLWEAQEDKPGVVFLDGEKGHKDILNAVGEAKAQADVVLVSLHWGYENTIAPAAWQRQLAQDTLDAGATAILGHHPHVPFGVEIYKGKPVIYSLGNFLFHPYDPKAKESFVARLAIDLKGEVRVELYPILMEQGTVRLLEGKEADAVLDTIVERSRRLGTEWTRQGDRLETATR